MKLLALRHKRQQDGGVVRNLHAKTRRYKEIPSRWNYRTRESNSSLQNFARAESDPDFARWHQAEIGPRAL